MTFTSLKIIITGGLQDCSRTGAFLYPNPIHQNTNPLCSFLRSSLCLVGPVSTIEPRQNVCGDPVCLGVATPKHGEGQDWNTDPERTLLHSHKDGFMEDFCSFGEAACRQNLLVLVEVQQTFLQPKPTSNFTETYIFFKTFIT